jgi:hypothetical protein
MGPVAEICFADKGGLRRDCATVPFVRVIVCVTDWKNLPDTERGGSPR